MGKVREYSIWARVRKCVLPVSILAKNGIKEVPMLFPVAQVAVYILLMSHSNRSKHIATGYRRRRPGLYREQIRLNEIIDADVPLQCMHEPAPHRYFQAISLWGGGVNPRSAGVSGRTRRAGGE